MTTLSVSLVRRLEALRAHLSEGARQAARHDFIEDFDVQDIIARGKARVNREF
jgi:hypothetical protein